MEEESAASTADSYTENRKEQEHFPECNFRTRSGSMKSYQIRIVQGEVVFSRPGSSQQSVIKYDLDKIQCVKNTHATEQIYCLLLIQSSIQQRCVYFTTPEAQSFWHEEILRSQGFWEERINQYEPVKKLGEGSFGIVLHAKHRYSGVSVAVKSIVKAKTDAAFKRNNQDFIEL